MTDNSITAATPAHRKYYPLIKGILIFHKFSVLLPGIMEKDIKKLDFIEKNNNF